MEEEIELYISNYVKHAINVTLWEIFTKEAIESQRNEYGALSKVGYHKEDNRNQLEKRLDSLAYILNSNQEVCVALQFNNYVKQFLVAGNGSFENAKKRECMRLFVSAVYSTGQYDIDEFRVESLNSMDLALEGFSLEKTLRGVIPLLNKMKFLQYDLPQEKFLHDNYEALNEIFNNKPSGLGRVLIKANPEQKQKAREKIFKGYKLFLDFIQWINQPAIEQQIPEELKYNFEKNIKEIFRYFVELDKLCLAISEGVFDELLATLDVNKDVTFDPDQYIKFIEGELGVHCESKVIAENFRLSKGDISKIQGYVGIAKQNCLWCYILFETINQLGGAIYSSGTHAKNQGWKIIDCVLEEPELLEFFLANCFDSLSKEYSSEQIIVALPISISPIPCLDLFSNGEASSSAAQVGASSSGVPEQWDIKEYFSNML